VGRVIVATFGVFTISIWYTLANGGNN